jgi:DNA-binding CsgD family transcriptional regulator
VSDRPLRWNQVRALFRAVRECYELLPAVDPRPHLLARLCEILGARVATTATVNDLQHGSCGLIEDPVHVGLPERDARRLLAPYQTLGSAADPLIDRMLSRDLRLTRADAVAAAARTELVDDSSWYAHPAIAEDRSALGLDDSLHAYRVTADPRRVCGLHLVRSAGDRPFDARDRNLVGLLLLETPQLLMAPARPPEGALAPRVQATLVRLLRGESEKAVAAALGISVHTVHSYVKRIYRAYGVQSRAELLATFLSSPPRPRP